MNVALKAMVFSIVMLMGSAAWAQDFEPYVDWEEAVDFAKVVGSFVDEHGETWETYLDEEQDVSWVQPATASREAVLASMEAGKFGVAGPEDLCIYFPIYPYKLTIYDSGDWEHYYAFTYQGSCGTNCALYYSADRDCWTDVDGYVRTEGRSSSDYSVEEWYFDLDSGGDPSLGVDDWDKWEDGDFWYYEMMEENDIEGEPEWDYCSGSTTKVSRYRYYACYAYRYLEIGYRYTL
jgi:hypothetical protein